MHATLVLLNWRRPQNLQKIVDSKPYWCREVVIWNNAPEPIEIRGARVVQSPVGNCFTLGRFLAANFASHDVVISQDDDCVVHNWDELRARFLASDRLVTNIHYTHEKLVADQYRIRDQDGKVIGYESLLGWGSIWRRKWQHALVDLSIASGVHHHHLVRRKADRLFCMCQEDGVQYVPCEVTHLREATKSEALYRRKDHWRLTDEARELFVRYKAGAIE